MSRLLAVSRGIARVSQVCCSPAIPLVARPALRTCSTASSAPAKHRTISARAADVAAPASTSDMGKGKDDVKGDMLAPSIVNKQWFRAVAVAGTVAATAAGSSVLPAQGSNFIHLLSYGILLGTNVWNSFFVGLTMFKNMPRQTFGRVQSKLFPQYFTLTTATNFILLGSLYVAGVPAISTPFISLGAAAAFNVANWLYLEPKCTGLMFERYAIENKSEKTEADEADIKRLYKQFGMWHGISALANLVTLAGTAAYGWSLAAKLTLPL